MITGAVDEAVDTRARIAGSGAACTRDFWTRSSASRAVHTGNAKIVPGKIGNPAPARARYQQSSAYP